MLDPADAQSLGEELDRLLQQAADSPQVGTILLDRLAEFPPIRKWSKKALSPEDEWTLKGDIDYPDPAGDPEPVPAGLNFVCPQCPDAQGRTFTWTRRYVGQPIPPCPSHGCSLDPAP